MINRWNKGWEWLKAALLRIEAKVDAGDTRLAPRLEALKAQAQAIEAALAAQGAQVDQQGAGLRDAIAAQSARLDILSGAVDIMQREQRLVLSALSLPPPGARRGPAVAAAPVSGEIVFPRSAVCRQDAFETPIYSHWLAQLGVPFSYHRKGWEFVFILQSLWERGALREGARGLGFAVGTESLPALFAAHGCEIVASDMSEEAAQSAGWVDTVQHAAAKEALRRPWICDDDRFDRKVDFRVVDMNHVPSDLTDFDFCWSACALEHLGSIEHGLAFVERSIDCLKPGGWAVHTTEFNLSSNDQTLDNISTVLFRQQDMQRLAERLTAKGHHVAPIDFDPGAGQLDAYIDLPPYRADPHMKLAFNGYACTSIGLIVQRGGHHR